MEEFKEEQITKLAQLCRISCSEEEKLALHQHLDKVLRYIDLLQEVNTDHIEPCSRALELSTNVMREDVVEKTLSREEFLANAPSHVGGMIRVPPIIKFSNKGS